MADFEDFVVIFSILFLCFRFLSRRSRLRQYAMHCTQISKAHLKRRSIHAPNLTDELSTAEERRLNQFGSAD